MTTEASERSRPTGAQWTVRRGGDELVVVEFGGGIRSYTRGGVDVVARVRPRRDVRGRPRSAAHPLAEPAARRDVRVRRRRASARPLRTGEAQRQPRPGPLDHVGPARPDLDLDHRRPAPAPAARLGLGARADDDLRPGRRRPHRDDDRPQRRRGGRALRLRRPPVPLHRRHPGRRGRAGDPGGHLPRDRPRAAAAGRNPPGRGVPVRLPHRAARSATSRSTRPSRTWPAAPTAGGRSPSAASPPAR